MLAERPYKDGLTTQSPHPRPPLSISAGPIHIDQQTFTVSANDRPVALTRLEFDLLSYIIANANRVVTHQELLQQVIQTVYRKESSLIRVHIAHLRKKLGPSAHSITTVRGRGFLFQSNG